MKILQCHIENFGKWSDKTFTFSDGCNSFCEENGWGKSTLAAFIRIMLYGFANERKKDELENERKKYMPWQSGVYGGQITFEANGVTYVASRIFGKKEKEDVFELRYRDTNKKSSDFSENLGEELFHIDQDSFLRTVFITQNDCETKMTDGMSAKIGNLELQKDDMSNFEKANEQILDMLNKMSPTRKTGSLYKMSEMIGALSMRVRQKGLMEQSIDKLFGYRKEEQEKLKLLEQEKMEWLRQQKNRTAQNELLMKKKEYEGYCKNYQQRMEQYQNVRNYFPISLPRSSELERYVSAGARLLEEKRSTEIYQLTDKEQEMLAKLEEKSWEDTLEKSEQCEETVDSDESYEENGKTDVKNLLGNRERNALILGSALSLFGLIGIVAKLDFGIVFLLAGVWIGGISVVWQKKNLSGIFGDAFGKEDAKDFVQQDFFQREKEMQEELKQWEFERYQQLQEKERLYERAYQKNLTLQKEISSYIKSLGFVPAENLQEQMQEMKGHFLECKTAYQEYKTAKAQKEQFEEQCEQLELILQMDEFQEDSNADANVDTKEKKESVSDARRNDLRFDWEKQGEKARDERLQKLLDEMDACKTEISKIDIQLEQLLEQKDSILESEQELEKQQELYREGKQKYEDLKKVQEHLQNARDSFSAKYAGPIQAGFEKYYQMLTGQEASGYKLDVNANLTVTIYGMQRDSRLLSHGQRDLMGLCLRMAFVEAMYQQERPFLILDDPFVNLDEEKTEKGLELLGKIGREYQILYFTCHESRNCV